MTTKIPTPVFTLGNSCVKRFIIQVLLTASGILATRWVYSTDPPWATNDRNASEWKIYYTWKDVQQESVFTPVAQDDWQRATNIRGHWIGLDIFPRDNVEARIWILADQPIIPIDANSRIDLAGGSRKQEWRARFDMTLYF